MDRTDSLARGLWGVLATPFAADGRIDEASMTRQLDLHRAAGSVGVVALGVFGEGARLEPAEQERVVEMVVSSADRLPVVVGLSDLRTETAVANATRLRAAAGHDVDFMVQVNSADPAELSAHLGSISDATGAGIVLQDYPVASGVSIPPVALVAAAQRCPFVVGVKSEAPPTSVAIAEIAAQVDVPVFGGLGGLGLLDELMAGAAGAMTGFSYPEALAAVVSAFATGGYSAARETYLPWLPLVNFEAQAVIGLAIRKSSLTARGIFSNSSVRPPGVPMDPALLPLLREHLAAVRERGVR